MLEAEVTEVMLIWVLEVLEVADELEHIITEIDEELEVKVETAISEMVDNDEIALILEM